MPDPTLDELLAEIEERAETQPYHAIPALLSALREAVETLKKIDADVAA